MTKREQKRAVRIVSSVLIALTLILLQHYGLVPGQDSVEESAQSHTPGLYRVVKFDDGDTIAVDMEGKKETIRFIGVDTPETHDPRKPVQCFGTEASAFTKQTIADSRVRLEADRLSGNRDRYDRLLRFVYLPDGQLLNQTLIEEGYGFAITGFPHTKMESFVNSETEAKSKQRGLWGQCELETINGLVRTAPV